MAERLALSDVHTAVEVLVSANEADPVYIFCYPGAKMRRIFLYTLFYPQMIISIRSCRVMRNGDGKMVSAVIFEDENPLLQLVGFLFMSFLMYYAILKKVGLEFFGHWNPLTFVGAIFICVVLAPLSLLFWLRLFLFCSGFIRSSIAGAVYMRKAGWHKKKKKHLLAIGTLAYSSSGSNPGLASCRLRFTLLAATCTG